MPLRTHAVRVENGSVFMPNSSLTLYLKASYKKAPSKPPRTGPTTYIQRFPSGVRLKTAEANVGPHVLAGLRDPPEIGPNIQTMAARANPMVTPARLGSAALSVAPNTVKTRMAVPITSARSTAPIPNPGLGMASPRNVDYVARTSPLLLLDIHNASWTNPAIDAPASWPRK